MNIAQIMKLHKFTSIVKSILDNPLLIKLVIAAIIASITLVTILLSPLFRMLLDKLK